MAPRFHINCRPLTLAAFAVPVGLGLGAIVSHLTWEAPEIALPELCITALPNGETTVSEGACEPEPMAEI